MILKSEVALWLALSKMNWVITIEQLERIYSNYNSIALLWSKDLGTLFKLGLNEKTISRFLKYRDSPERNAECERLSKLIEREGINLVTYVDGEYPNCLKDFGNYYIKPPLALLVKGSIDSSIEGVAIVGTRECSFYGHTMSRKLARTIAKKGYTIISGLARGTDTEAHCGALEAPSGKTIAVLPWLSEIYPEENAKLAFDIAKNGAIMSEYYEPPREYPNSQARAAFVIRNRIISGLSRCVILIESGLSGGTFRQATIAFEQGRKVFALKPKHDNIEGVEGFKKFVEMGATPIDSAKLVLEYLKNFPSNKTKEKRIDSFYQSGFGK